MEKLLLGIDIGTSACKVAAFDYHGNVKATSAQEYKVYYPNKGWAEQNAQEWYSAVCVAVSEVVSLVGSDGICAVGIDGQGWSCIPIDKNGKVLHNTPIWFDTRATAECEEITEKIGFDRIFQNGGNPLTPSYSAPKALWFKKNMPELYNNTYKFLISNNYIGYRLTGNIKQDKCQSYGHFFYNVEKGVYDANLCSEAGLDIEKFPEIVECHDIIGEINSKSAAETGLKIGTPVVAGGLDAACGTLGAGVYKNGQTQAQGGQAGGMSICVDRHMPHPKLIYSNHVVPGAWLLQGGTVGGGGVMRWLSQEFGGIYEQLSKETGQGILQLMDKEAANITAGSEGLIFLPYMMGERSPIWDTDAKGVYFGLSYAKGKGHMFRAALEGVAYALQHNIMTAAEVGVKIDEMYAVGGASNSRLWMQIKSDVTNIPIKVPHSDAASTLGAAILAGVGMGYYKGFDEAVNATVRISSSYSPNEDAYKVYQRYYPIYLELYEKLKETMKKV